MSPALLLAVLFVLIGAQAARVVSPRRGSYPWLLVLAVAGLAGSELASIALHTGGPSIGVLHPIADAIGIAVVEAAGLVMARRRRVAA
ncbi:MAG: hypothetical protein JOY80_08070 [Candidatus Dormibacteraeota bacterium]|nr:hypothetical protein [Candidatus Dormibacteraeota bacterium]